MATTSPFSFVQQALEPLLLRVQPPQWLVAELQQRLVLLLNHVLMQEPEAQARLKRHSGKVAVLQWSRFSLCLQATPAGLLNLGDPDARIDLTLAVLQESPTELARDVMAGKTPPVKIEGDVQLAAEVGWLAENLRWDIEEDLSRLMGDAPAHTLAQAARKATAGLRQWLGTAAMPKAQAADKAAP
jgi:ubiquinone biosynthesis accessory factor UbiJ